METKLQKKILGRKIKSYQFYKMQHPAKGKEVVNGFIWLEGTRIRVENGKFFILDNGGKKGGVILKTSADYRTIKRMIRRWFSAYRNNVIESVSYWRSRAIDGLHNVQLFRLSGISFKENPSTFLKLAS